MAALVLPVLDPRASDVLYTRDLRDQAASQMILNAVWGLAAGLMSGQTESDTFVASRSDPKRLLGEDLADKQTMLKCVVALRLRNGTSDPVPLSPSLVRTGFCAPAALRPQQLHTSSLGSIPLLLPQWLDGVSDALAYGLR
jgi:hypothetical protein